MTVLKRILYYYYDIRTVVQYHPGIFLFMLLNDQKFI